MIDWSEGHHELKQLVQALYEALLHDEHGKAAEICTQIVVVARLTRARIQVQS